MALKFSLRDLYLYAFSAVGMIFMLMGLISLINYGIRISLIPEYPVQNICYENADFIAHEQLAAPERPPGSKAELRDCNDRELLRNAALRRERRVERIAGSLIILIIGIPLYLYH